MQLDAMLRHRHLFANICPPGDLAEETPGCFLDFANVGKSRRGPYQLAFRLSVSARGRKANNSFPHGLCLSDNAFVDERLRRICQYMTRLPIRESSRGRGAPDAKR